MSGAHAKFSPSGAHRWINCAGSMLLEQDYPNTSSKYADEGTAAHFLAAECLKSGKNAADHKGKWILVPKDGGEPFFTPASSGAFEVSDDFANNVQVYVNDVRDRVAAVQGDLFIEQRLNLSDTLATEDQFGTSDAVIAAPAQRLLIIEDLKFGMGEQVWAEENEQMMLYALGALESLDLIYGADAFDTVTPVICQPRLDHIDDTWSISVADLRQFGAYARRAVGKVKYVLANPTVVQTAPEVYLIPETKTCRWCRAKASCSEYAKKVSQLVSEDFTAIDGGKTPALAPQVQTKASDEVIGKRYGAIEFVSNWVKAVETEAEARVFKGAKIIGSDGLPLKIVTGKQGNRAWADPKAVVGVLAGILPPEKLYYPQEVVSVPDAESAIGKKKFAVLAAPGDPETNTPPGPLAAFISRAPGKPVVALGSDKRAPYDNAAGKANAEEFGAVNDPLAD